MQVPRASLDIDRVVASLLNGGVVLIPTDTVYGLAALPTRPDAVARIYELKRRPRERRLPVIVEDADQVRALGLEWPESAERLAAAFWPGALTIAVGVRAPTVDWLAGRDEVGLRAPASELALAIARATGPFLMTSANLSGQATHPVLADVLVRLNGSPDVAIDGGELGAVSSTLVNTNLPEPLIEREGAIPAADIEAVLARA